MLVRNEEWVLRCSLRAALEWCDAVVIIDHASSDRTRMILEEIGAGEPAGRVVIRSWPDSSRWDEMAQRQLLLELAREAGATHLALVDADEVLTANFLPHVRKWIAALTPGQILDVPLVPVWQDLDHYRDDGSEWCRQFVTIAVADCDGIYWAPEEADGYQHHCRAPRNAGDGFVPTSSLSSLSGGMMHLQWAARERLLWKHRSYKLFERLRWPDRQTVAELDAKYSRALDETGMALSRVPSDWWGGYRRDLINPAHETWYVDECERLWQEHGSDTFVGLNLWGWPADAR
ncbi:glycosyltransferase family 2 protein [Streptomyces sp. NPDC098789]|uniref:glycosyltransferase family 2 protein n=1 Tax=Streptomyces sp. NPDC098789 TaxID=3366098 RepID=UPI00380A39B9